jgi:hypothetical protein
MQRQLSNSSHVTESSQTTNYIHSNIGDSISSPNPVVPGYPRRESGAFFWNNGQVQVEDDNTFIADSHSLLPPATQLPQLILSAEHDLLNVEPSVNDPDALFTLIITRLQQEYRAQSDRLTYARNLARTYLGVDSINSFLPSREQTFRPPRPRIQPRPNSQHNQKKEHYVCLLCDSPLPLCSRGAFKRHVNEMHRHKSVFLCMHCNYLNPRKDKLRDHLRLRHPRDGGYTAQELDDRELILDVPSSCDLCEPYESPIHNPPFQSWQSWFEGIEMHCRVEDDEEKQSDNGSNSHDQDGGSAGGAGGGYFPNTPFLQGPNVGGLPFSQGNNWPAGAAFSQWPFNTQTRCVSQASGQSQTKQACTSNYKLCACFPQNHGGLESRRMGHRKDASASSSKELSDPSMKILSGKDLSPETDSVLTNLSNKLSTLYLGHKPKDIPGLSGAQASLSTQKDPEITKKMILEKSFLISNVIHELDLASLVYSVNQISLHSYGRSYNKIFDDYGKIVFTVDPLVAGEITLHRIHYDHSISSQIVLRQLSRCHASLNAIQWELTASPPWQHTTPRQLCRRKRLSSLWARLRAVTFVLSLQKEVVDEQVPNLQLQHSSIVESQPNLTSLGRKAIPQSTVYIIRSLYKLAQKYLSEPYGISMKKGGSLMPLENSLGVSDLSDFLQTLTYSISTPKSSILELYENNDLYGFLHNSISSIPAPYF